MNYLQYIKKIGIVAALVAVIFIVNFAAAGKYIPLNSANLQPNPFLNVSGAAQSKQGWLALGGVPPTVNGPLATLDVKGAATTFSLSITGNVLANGKMRIGGWNAPVATDPSLVVGDPQGTSLRIRSSVLAGTGDRSVCSDSTGLFKICSTNPVAAACGSANANPVASAPTSNLCSTGTASAVTGTGPWNWTCAGQNGGQDAACSAPTQAIANGTLTIKKIVVNNNTGVKTASQFTIHVLDSNSVDVAGSPQPGSGSGYQYSLTPGTYTVSEDNDNGYNVSYSTDCPGGVVTLASGASVTCTLTNDDKIPHGSANYFRNGSNNQYVLADPSACPGCTAELFQVPVGVTSISMEAIGGGAGGGAAGVAGLSDGQTTPIILGGGGGGGGAGHVKLLNVSVVPGQIYAILVGKNGAPGIIGNPPTCNGSQWAPTNLGPLPGLYFQGFCQYDSRTGGAGEPSIISGPTTGTQLPVPHGNPGWQSSELFNWLDYMNDNVSSTFTLMASGGWGGRGTSNGTGGVGGLGGYAGQLSQITLDTLATGFNINNFTTGTYTQNTGHNGTDGASRNSCSLSPTSGGGLSGLNAGAEGNGGRSGYAQFISYVFPTCTLKISAPVAGTPGKVSIWW